MNTTHEHDYTPEGEDVRGGTWGYCSCGCPMRETKDSEIIEDYDNQE